MQKYFHNFWRGYSFFRHVLPAFLISIGMTTTVTQSASTGVILAGIGLTIITFDQVRLRMERDLIAFSPEHTKRRD